MKKNSSYWYCPKCKEELDGCHVTYQELCEYCGTAVLSVPEGISQGRLEEIIEAETDGRLVILPCKVGESLYAIVNCADIIKSCDDDYFTGTGAISCSFEKDCPFEECDDGNRGVFETACKGFWVDDEGRLNVFLDYINANIGPLDFGKTVFLTREAAENALGGAEK